MKEEIKIIKITNKLNIQNMAYKNNTLKLYNNNLNRLYLDNTTVKISNKSILLEIYNQKITKFESNLYYLSKKIKIQTYDFPEDLECINVLKKRISKKNLNLFLYLLFLIINIKYFIVLLTHLSVKIVIYLNDTPIGIKQNVILKNYFTKFFLVIFKVHLKFIRILPGLFPLKIFLLHLIVIHNTITKIYYITFKTICDCLNIFRGRNFNKMKNRIDKINYTPDVIVLSSFVFVFSLLILYTIFGFFLFSLFFRLIFISFYFLFHAFTIFFTENFSKKGFFIKNKIKKITNYQIKKINLIYKIKFIIQLSLKINKINNKFIFDMFRKDYQIKVFS